MTNQQDETRDRQRFTIKIAAELVSVHQQTLRHYERLGLLEPERGKGEIRYFTPDDIERAQQIRRLVNELGVNLAGVEVILNMREQMQRMQRDANDLINRMMEEHDAETRRLKEIIRRLQGEPDEVGAL